MGKWKTQNPAFSTFPQAPLLLLNRVTYAPGFLLPMRPTLPVTEDCVRQEDRIFVLLSVE